MNTKAISLIYIIVLLSLSNIVSAKDFYWIGGSGNWNEIQHWSDQPGGQVNPDAAVPNFSDNVFFDEHSFPTTGAEVIINDVAKCANMDWSKVTNSPKFKANNNPAHYLTIYGSMKLGTNMLLNLLKPLYFSASTLGNEIDFAGHIYNEDIHFSKNGGWIIKTPLHAQNHNIYFEQGSLSFEADITCGQIISDNSTSRTWALNNSTVTLTESGASILNINADNLNLNSGTSTIISSGIGASIQISGSSAISFNDIEFQKNAASITNGTLQVNFNNVEFKAGGSLQGPNSFQNLTFTKGNNYQIQAGSTQTIIGQWTAKGDCSQHINISSSGGSGNINANATLLEYVKVNKIIASGTAVFDAVNSFDLGGNSGWNFTAPTSRSYSWVGGTDNKWSTPANWNLNCVPSRIDDASIGAFNVEIDTDAECKTLILSDGATLSGASKLSIFGSLNAGNAIWNLLGTTYFEGSGTNSISINNSFKADVYFSEENGTWNLATELKIPDNNLFFESGTINSNSNDIEVNKFISIGGNPRNLNLGPSTVRLNGNSPKTWHVEGSSFTITNSAYTINLVEQTAGFYNNHNTSINYKTVYFTDDRGKANLTNEGATVNFFDLKFFAGANISGDHNFETFTLSAGKTYLFEAGSEQKITNANGFIAEGTCSEFIYLEGNGGISTIRSDVNSNKIHYVQVTDLEVKGGIPHPGGLNAQSSFGIANYTGWNITQKLIPEDFKWVGTDGADWFNPNNWDLGCVPTRIDNVFFDAGNIAPSGSKTITINGTRLPECNNMTWSNASTLLFNGGSNLCIYGNLDFTSLPSSSFTHTGDIYFKSENIVNVKLDQVTLSNDVVFEGEIQEDGSWLAGTWNLGSDFKTINNIELVRGKLITNDYSITCNKLNSNYIDVRTLQLGASIIKLNGIVLTPKNLNFIAGTSEIIISEDGKIDITSDVDGGINALDFNNITFDQTAGTALFSISGKTVSFNQMEIKSNANFLNEGFDIKTLTLNQGKTYKFHEGKTYNIGDITANGACEGTIDISSLSAGNKTTFNSKNGTPISVTQVNLLDIFATGGTFTANNSINLGNNTGWTFSTTPTSRNLFWVDGPGNWDDPNHWAISSGGAPGACVPTSLDNVHFDMQSFTGNTNQIVSTGSGDIRCRTMDWTGSEGNNPILQMGAIDISSVYIYGSLILNRNLTVDLPNVDFYFRSTETGHTLSLFSFEFPNDVSFDGIGGEWTLIDNLSADGSLILDNGHFISGGNAIICNYFESSDISSTGKTRVLDIQNSTLTVLGYEGSFSVKIDATDGIGRQTLTLIADGSELIIEREKAFVINGINSSRATFNIIRFKNESKLNSNLILTRVNDLIFEEGGELKGNLDIGKFTLNKGTKPNTFKFESDVTFPIEEFIALGSCNFPIHIRGSKNNKQADIEIKTSIDADFIELTDINGVGSKVTYNASNSLIHTNVTNWTVDPISSINLYWVGNGLNDEWSNYLNWSKTSGGVSEGCIPTELDNVFFDSNSFLGSKTVLVNSDARCHNMTWEDDINSSPTFKVQNQLDIHGFLNFNENMKLDMSGDLKFKGDELIPDKEIDFAGKTLNGNIYFDGKNQSWILKNELSTTGDLILDEGSFNSMGNNMTISSFSSINVSPLANRSLNIAGSIVTVNAEKYKSWSMILIGSPMTFTAVNSELYFPKKGGIYCESGSDLIFGDAIFDGYGQIDINGNGIASGKGEFKTIIFRHQGQILGDHTISNLEFTLGYGENSIQGGRTINLTNELIMEGVNCSYVYLKSSTPGTKAYINSAKLQTIYHASLEDIEMTDANIPHRIVGNYINVGGSSIGWLKTVEPDDLKEPPSFQDILPVREEWCSSATTLEHVKHFPINDRTTFQWAYSPDGVAAFTDEPGETSATIVVNKSGFFRVQLNYNNPSGVPCLLYSTIEVIMNTTSNITIEFTEKNIECYGENNGFIKAVAKNGNAPYTFFWEDEAGIPVAASSPTGKNESYASNLAPGKYTVTVTDDKTCEQTSSTNVFNAYEIFVDDVTKKDLKCFNVSNGEIHIDARSANGPLTYYLDGDLESADITGLPAAEYLVHVQDGNDCKSDETSIEILSPTEITFNFSPSHIDCSGDKSGAIDPQVKGGIKPYEYKWTATNGFTSTLGAITNLDGGIYTIEVTDGNDCVYASSIEIKEPEEIVLSQVSIENVDCFGNSSGELYVEASKGTPPYDYKIDTQPSNTTGRFINLSANTYTLEVTDKNKCTKTQAITIDEPIKMGFVISDNISPSCKDLKDGIINIVPYGGNSDYTFSWSGPNDFRSYTRNNTGLDFGEYTLLLKDKKECVHEETVNLIKNSPLQLGLVIEEEVSTRGANNGIFRLEILGGTIPYTYTVTGPNSYSKFSPTFFDQDEATFENLVGGLYTVTITDKSSCGAITKDIMLPEGNLLVSQITNQENISCTGYNDGVLSATAIGGNGTYSYSWTGPLGYTASTKTITGLAAGTYTLTVQSSGQSATDESIIIEPTPLVATSSHNNVACFNEPNGSIELDISGGTKPYSILWEGDRGLFSHSDKIYDLAKGDYDYQVTDKGGCIVSNTVTINEPSAVTITAVPTDITAMGLRDGKITATATGGTPPYTIFISGPNKYSKKDFGNTTGICSVDILEQGVYIVEVLDANGCRAITETRIYESEKMVVSLVDKTTPICHGGNEGSIEVLIEELIGGGSPDYTLSWEGDNHYKKTSLLKVTNKSKIENLKAGKYTLTVTNNVTGEIIIFKQEIKEPDLVKVEVSMDQISCFGLTDGHINIYPRGGTPNYTYEWTGVSPASVNKEDQGNLSQGTYTVKVTDANLCKSKVYTFDITEPALFAGNHTIKEPLCYGDKNGEVTLDITSGAVPYTVNWNTGSITENIRNLRIGTYAYTVVDNEDCEFKGKVDLTQPDTLIAKIDIFNDVVCYGQNNGEASASVTGGSVPYKFDWSNGKSTQDISNLRPKKYNLIVTDDHDCKDTASVVIEEPEELLLRVEAHRPTIEGANDGAIFSKAFGGIPAHITTWEIETGVNMWSLLTDTDLEINDLDRGKYKLTLSDNNSCTRDTIINLEYLYDRIIEIPKAFTPNQDGYNDYWDILRIEYIQRLKIVIYDRLGTVMYKFSGTGNEYKGNPWTGKNSKSHVPIGSYYYAIEADDSKPLTGTVTIAR